MKAIYYDISTTHNKGEFCKRIISKNYFISYFQTPFLYEREGVLVHGNAGDMLIVKPGTPVYHGAVDDSEQGFINDWIYLYGEEMTALLGKYPLPINTAFSVDSHNILRRYIEKIKKETSAQATGYEDKILYLTGQLVIDLHRQNRRMQASNSPPDRIETAREEIMQNLEHPWSLAEMAALCGYSISRFSALYKKQFGCSPKQDILNARIDLAARMLKYTNSSVTEIAAACGFQTIYYFSKYFKAAKGISPREYSERNKQ